MLITLKSNLLNGTEDNVNTANQFSNYFPGGLIIRPNSEIGLLNCTYNIQEGFVIEGAPLQIIMYIPPDTRAQVRQIPVGSYTGDELAAAIETALNVVPLMNASNNVFPSTGFKCSFDDTKHEFTLDLPWDPVDEVQYNINTDEYATVNGSLISSGLQQPITGVPNTEQSLYYKNNNVETYLSNSMTSVRAGEVYNANAMGIKVSNLATENPYFASYEIQATSTVGIEARIGFSHPNVTDVSNSNIQLALDGAGAGQTSSVVAYENNGAGAPARIEFDPPATAAANEQFRILLPVQYNSQAKDHENAIYQKYVNNAWETLKLASGSQRYTIKGSDSVVFRASIRTPAFINEPRITNGADVLTLGDGILEGAGITLAAAGIGYMAGEAFTLAAGAASTVSATGFITGVDANGGITNLDLQNIGQGYQVEGPLVITGLDSGSVNGTINIVQVTAHATLATGGANYAVGDVLSVQGGAQPDLRFTVLAENAGVITQLSISANGNNNYANGTPMFINKAGGAVNDHAQITLNNAASYYPSIKNLKMTGFVAHPADNAQMIHNPLGLQQNIRADMSTLGPLIGITGVQHSTIPNPPISAGIDETGVAVTPNSRVANNLLVHLDNFPIKSKHKGGEGRCIAALPYGDGTKSGLFQDRSYNLVYHGLENKTEENHNEIRVRLTDAEGGLIQGLLHPTVINCDLRPRTI